MYGLLLATMLALDPCAPLRALPDPEPPRTQQRSEHRDALARHRAIRQNQEAGEQRLRTLARLGAYEQAWLWVAQEGSWYEAGPRGSEDAASVDTRFLAASFKAQKELTFYHHHPAQRLAKQTWQERKQAFPSRQDLTFAIYSSVLFLDAQPDGAYDSRVVSTFGVTSYRLTPLGRQCFRELWRKAPAYGALLEERLVAAPDNLDEELAAMNNPYLAITLKR